MVSSGLIDALHPAVEAAKKSQGLPLSESVEIITEAARMRMEITKELVALTGRAKTYGSGTVGYPDPGSITTYIQIKSMAEYIAHLEASPD